MNRLSRRIWAAATGAALLLATGVVAAVPASGAPRAVTVTCPTVSPTTGAVTPPPANSVDWSGCDLTGANLTSASLITADLSGANLTRANLTKADFDGADLAGANLTKANLTQVWLGSTNSTGANFTGTAGAKAYFTSADLTRADFNGVKLSGDVMVFATLTSAKFAHADLDHADLTGVSAARADLTGANLSYASIASTPGGLTGNPSYGMFSGADLAGANLAHANVAGAGLAGANLAHVISGGLSGVTSSLPANFSQTGGYLVGPYANLAGANLAGAFAVNDSFAHVNLAKATLAGADLASADFGSANLTGISLKGANLTGAELTATNATLKNVAWSAATTCPNGHQANARAGCFARPAVARPPLIKVSVRRGVPGTALTVTGSGFAANEPLTVSVGTGLTTVKTSGTGGFGPVSLTVTASAQPGLLHITATGKSKGQSAAAWFTVAANWDQAHYAPGLTGDNTAENTLSPAKAPKLAEKFLFNPAQATGGAFPVSVDDGAAFLASARGPLTAIDAATGKRLWTWREPASWGSAKSAPQDKLSQPVLAGGTAYLSVAGQGLVAVSAGKMLWQNNIEPLDEFDNAVNLSQPTLANGVLYAVEGDFVYALDAASGLQLWLNPVAGTASPPACGQPAVAAGVAYLSCDNGYLYALDAASGASLWSYLISGDTTFGYVAASGGTVYVTTSSASGNGLVAISTSTHKQEWSATAAATLGAPAIAGNAVYAVAQNGVLYALNAVTGGKLWSASLNDKPVGSNKVAPSVADGVVYALSDNGVVYAFNAGTGARLWRDYVDNELVTAPVIANGIVYIGARSGGVAVFAAR